MSLSGDRDDWFVSNLGAVCRAPSGTVLLGYRGSVAHNMYIPNTDPNSIDDVDLMGFVVGEPKHYLGLSEWGSRGTKEYVEGQYDCVFYEFRKAVHLLLQGNPNVLGMLWLRPQDYIYSSAVARELVVSRPLFVGKHVYPAFAGYAHAQLSKMESRNPAELREYIAITDELKHRGVHPNYHYRGELLPEQRGQTGESRDAARWSTEKLLSRMRSFQKKGENIGYLGDKRKALVLEHGYDSKNAAHLVRLLRMCREFMATGEMQVYRTTDAAELLDIKRGKWDLQDVKALAADLFEECRQAKEKSTLPEGPDREGVEALTIRLVKEALAGSM